MVRPGSQCARILAVLADSKSHTTTDLYRRCGGMILHSRINELRRKHGYRIICEHLPGKTGARAYRYTWLDAPGLPASDPDEFTLNGADVAPRDERNRYRIYRLTADALLELVATCATAEAVGVTLCTLGLEGEWPAGTAVGLMDTHGTDNHSGTWLLSPWNPGAWTSERSA